MAESPRDEPTSLRASINPDTVDPAPPVDVSVDTTPVRAEVYRVGQWTYRIRLYAKEGWLVATHTEFIMGGRGRVERRAERRAERLLAEARKPPPGPIYVAEAP